MSDRTWHKGWNGLDENPERHSGCPHDHHASYRDDEPHMRFRGGRSDIHQDRCDPPEHHPRNDYGDRERDQDGSPDGSVQPHDGGNLGWDDAGGFEAMLLGHLSDTFAPAGGFPPIIVFAIDDLDVEFNSLIQTTQIQNTLVFLNASDGSPIDIGGDVNADSFQSASVEQSTALMNLPDLA